MWWRRKPIDVSTPEARAKQRRRVFDNREAANREDLFLKVLLAESDDERDHAEWALIGWYRRHPREDPGELKTRLYHADCMWVYDRIAESQRNRARYRGPKRWPT